MARQTLHGRFEPQNKSKYKGSLPIVYRSSWELNAFVYLDREPNVVAWGSESVVIPYQSPLDGKVHRYFTDLVFTTKNNKKFIIEIKPYSQVGQPVRGKKQEKTFIMEAKTWSVNMAKWKAACEFAKKHGMEFKIWTEKGIVNPAF